MELMLTQWLQPLSKRTDCKMFEDKEFEKEVYGQIPLGKLAEAQVVSSATLLLSSILSKFIIGDTIKVYGGWTAI